MRLEALSQALVVQSRVIHALMLRETKTRFGKHEIGYLWAVLEPMLFIAIFVATFTLANHTAPSGMPVVLFMITGITPFLIFRHAMDQTMSAVDANRALLAFPQVTIFDLAAARLALEIATMVLVFVLLLLLAAAFGEEIHIEDPLRVLGVLLLLALTGSGFGMTFGAFAALFPSVKQFVSAAFGRPMFFVSGLFFTAEMLPDTVRPLFLWNPVLHMIEMLRSAFFYEFESRYADPGYAVAFAVCVLFFGLLVQRSLRRRILSG